MDENNTKKQSPRGLLRIAIILSSLALLVAIALLNFNDIVFSIARNRNHSAWKTACINNLRQIDAAKQQWALENNKTNLDTIVTWNDVRIYFGRVTINSMDSVHCPEDKTRNASNSYTLGDLGSPPKCKINPATHFIK